MIKNCSYAFIKYDDLCFLELQKILEAYKAHNVDKNDLFFKILQKFIKYNITSDKDMDFKNIKKFCVKIV